MELFQKSGKAFLVSVEGVDVACSCSRCTDFSTLWHLPGHWSGGAEQCQGPGFWRCSMTVTTSLPSQWPISFLLPGFWSCNKCYVMWLGHSTTAHQGESWELWTPNLHLIEDPGCPPAHNSPSPPTTFYFPGQSLQCPCHRGYGS